MRNKYADKLVEEFKKENKDEFKNTLTKTARDVCMYV